MICFCLKYCFTLQLKKNIITIDIYYKRGDIDMRISGITYVPRKSHKVRNLFMLSALLILIVLVTIMSISAYVGWNLIHPKRIGLSPVPSGFSQYRDVSFYDVDKTLALKGWFFESPGSDKTVIISHGYAMNRLQFKQTTFSLFKSFIDKGYNVLSFDFRNCGESEGNYTSLGIYERKDLLGAVKHAKELGSKHIVLLGFSMGASTSILAAAESTDVEAVIADSPFSNLKEYLSENLYVWSKLPSEPFNTTIPFTLKYITGLDLDDSSPRDAVKSISNRPVLFIHSQDDKSIPIKNSIEMYEIYSKSAGDKGEFWETKGVDHIQSYEKYTDEYISKVFAFLDKVYPKVVQ